MLLASLVCVYNYETYEMEAMLFESVFIISLGSFIFTIVCMPLKAKTIYSNKFINSIPLYDKYKINNLIKAYLFLDVIAIACFFLKMYLLASFFGGNLSGSELIGEAKADASSGDLTFHYPIYITLMAFWGRTLSFFTCWFLAVSFFTNKINKKFRWLLILHFSFIIAEGFTSGTKDSILDPIFRFAVILAFLYFSKRKSTKLTRKIVLILLISLMSLVFGIVGISEIIGRNGLNDFESSDQYFSVYFGAEIKNFDIYMHGWDGNPQNRYWGQSTFSRLYEEILPNYKAEDDAFQDIGSVRLGNVYTQWFSFHKDFGYPGIIIMTIIMAFVSMYIFNHSLKTIRNPLFPNIYLFMYSSISMCIFMSFFSSRFTNHFFTIFFVRRMLLLWLLIYLLEHHPYFIKRQYVHRKY